MTSSPSPAPSPSSAGTAATLADAPLSLEAVTDGDMSTSVNADGAHSLVPLLEMDDYYGRYLMIGQIVYVGLAICAYIPLYFEFKTSSVLRKVLIALATIAILSKGTEAILVIAGVERRIQDVANVISFITMDGYIGLLVNLVSSALSLDYDSWVGTLLKVSYIETGLVVVAATILMGLGQQLAAVIMIACEHLLIIGFHFLAIYLANKATVQSTDRRFLVSHLIKRIVTFLTILEFLIFGRTIYWVYSLLVLQDEYYHMLELGHTEIANPMTNWWTAHPYEELHIEAGMLASRTAVVIHTQILGLVYLASASILFRSGRIQRMLSDLASRHYTSGGSSRPYSSANSHQHKTASMASARQSRMLVDSDGLPIVNRGMQISRRSQLSQGYTAQSTPTTQIPSPPEAVMPKPSPGRMSPQGSFEHPNV